MKRRSSLGLVVLAITLAACSSTTMIQSNVPGAKVYLDGELVGTTPYAMSDTKVVGSATQVRLEAPGYAPLVGVIKRNEEFSVGACIGGVFLLVPFLWIMEYKPVHTYELQPGRGGGGGGQWGAPADRPAGGWDRVPGGAKDEAPGAAADDDEARPVKPTRTVHTEPGGSGSAADRAEALNEEGKSRIQEVDYRGAAASFRAAIKADPDPRYYYNLCFTLYKMRDLREARAACERVTGRKADARLITRARELIEQIDQALQEGAATLKLRPGAV